MIKLLPYILFEKYIYVLALEMASSGNQHCANCIGTLSFPVLKKVTGPTPVTAVKRATVCSSRLLTVAELFHAQSGQRVSSRREARIAAGVVRRPHVAVQHRVHVALCKHLHTTTTTTLSLSVLSLLTFLQLKQSQLTVFALSTASDKP